jgi:glycosyltransferase involved in cell wall biosynthesis
MSSSAIGNQMHTPAISILLPFRREGDWLKEAIQSIRQQSFTDWELLLLAHEADHNSIQIALDAKQQDQRILLHEMKGRSLAEVLNQGIRMADGRYIARMDADDVSLPERLALQYAYLESHPNTGLVSCATAAHPSAITGEGFLHYMEWQNSIITAESHRQYRFVESPVAHPTVMYRSVLAQTGSLYPLEGPEDYGLWLQWMQDGIEFYKLPQPLLYWRDHPQRLSRSGFMYSSARFNETRIAFAGKIIEKNLCGRKLILCGAGTEAWRKKAIWEDAGIQFQGYSDVKVRNKNLPYFSPEEIGTNKECYYLSLLSGRGKAAEMLRFFISRGLTPEQDFLVAS